MAKEYSTVLPDLYRGIVEDNADDKHLGRCKVRVPAVYGDSKVVSKDSLPWALPISAYSVNKDRGSICIPDIGDYVWVMFEASDKTRPVYLGGFYAQSDIPIDETKVTVYIDKENAIIYDRKKESYDINVKKKHIIVNKDSITLDAEKSNAVLKKDSVTLNGDGSTIVVLEDSITEATPKVNISGELDVTEDVNMHKDLHVDGNIYCNMLYQTGGVFSNLDFTGMTQEEMDATLESLGINGSTDWLYIASQFDGFNEANGSADIFTNSLGFGSSASTPWCACFVSYCLAQAGISGLRAGSVSGLMSQGKSLGRYFDKNSYTPKPGDVFIEKGAGASHTGFVKQVFSDGSFTTWEGNSGDRVKSNHKYLSSDRLSGFISM